MVWNKNAGYGREQVESILASSNRPGGLTFGRTLYVLKTTDPNYDRIADLLPVDPEGEVRLFTTITAALAAVENYDTVLIGPGNFDEEATITLTGKKGVKIIGTNTGMQWGEGATCWRDVDSDHVSDLLNLTGNQAIEIAGINFINITDGKDAINFTGLNYSIHIHDCCFTGNVGGSDVQAYAINAGGSNAADLYVHDCKFFKQKTTAILNIGQRAVIKDNIFIVGAASKGISGCNAAGGFNIIADNYFIGAVSTGYGIYRESYTATNLAIINNRFIGFSANYDINQVASSDSSVVGNIADGTDGAAADIDPTA